RWLRARLSAKKGSGKWTLRCQPDWLRLWRCKSIVRPPFFPSRLRRYWRRTSESGSGSVAARWFFAHCRKARSKKGRFGKGDTEPSDVSAEERKQPARSGKCQPQHRIHAGISRHVTDAEHACHRDDGESQSHERFAENTEDRPKSQPKQKSSEDCGEKAARTSGGQPVKVEPRSFRRRLGYHRRGSGNFSMKIRRNPSLRARTALV